MFETIEILLKSKILSIAAVFLLLFYLYFKFVVYSYWAKRKIPHEKPSVPCGNIGDLLTKQINFGGKMRQCYEKFKKHPFHGLYMLHRPTLMLNDPEIIKFVLVKEFSSFSDRGLFFNDKIDPLSGHLFLLPGDRWRSLRIKLSPTLTSGKLKNMYPFVQEIANEMINVAENNLVKTDALELKDLIARYTTDTIFSLAFGFNPRCLKNPDSEFRHYGDLSIKNNPFVNAMAFFSPNIMDFLRIPLNNVEVTKFFVKLFEDMVENRKMNQTNRKDFLNLLIELMDYGQIKDNDNDKSKPKAEGIGTKLNLLEAAAQAFVFFVAGFETSSSMVTYTLYELALNPEEQEKVHQEIDELFKQHEGFNYENVQQLKYLEMAFYETMRKHPSLPFLNRICIKDCKLPNSDYVVPKGMPLLISISGLHHDPDIYPDPDKYDPTRFTKENIEARHPYTFLAFGEGPRICIGKRLGIMMSMVALATLFSEFKFSICDRTPIPNRYSLDSVLQSPRDGIYLRIEKRRSRY